MSTNTASTTDATWDTADAFKPNSGRFGSLVGPAAEVVAAEVVAFTPDEIVALRERLNWERVDLAAYCGASKSTIAGWELGYTPPSRRMAAKLRRLAAAATVAPPRVRSDKIVTCGCGREHFADRKCPECLCVWTPSPEEIAAGCNEIQSHWTEDEKATRRHRSGTGPDDWEAPRVPSEVLRNIKGRRRCER